MASPRSATYCYLKPDFLLVDMTWFQQEEIGFDPERVVGRDEPFSFHLDLGPKM